MTVKWTAFPSGTTISGSDVSVGLQSASNVQWLFSDVATYITGALTATGTGSFVKATSPSLVTPTLGVATATSVNKMAITAPATSSTLAVADGKTLTASNSGTLAGGDGFTLAIAANKTASFSASITITGTDGKSLTVSNSGTFGGGDAWVLAIAAGKTLTVSNSITLAGTDSTVMTFPTTSATVARTDAAQTFTGDQTFAGNAIYSVAASGPTLKRGANGRVGTFTANGATPVTVTNSSVAITDTIIISLNTVGGTGPIIQPFVSTITAGVGFTTAANTGDISVYNYCLIKNAA